MVIAQGAWKRWLRHCATRATGEQWLLPRSQKRGQDTRGGTRQQGLCLEQATARTYVTVARRAYTISTTDGRLAHSPEGMPVSFVWVTAASLQMITCDLTCLAGPCKEKPE